MATQSSWNQTTLGAMLYRAGKVEQSLEILNQAEQLDQDREGKGVRRQCAAIRRWFFLAMAHQRAGNSERARQWHNQATDAWNEIRRQSASGEIWGKLGWEGRPLEVLRAEAAELFGVPEDAEQSLRDDAQGLAKRAESDPTVPGYRKLLADKLKRLGDLLFVRKQFDAAEQEYRRALALLEKLHSEFPGEPSYRGEIGQFQMELSRTLWQIDKHEAAVEARRQSVLILERLLNEFPQARAHRVTLGHAYRWLGIRLDEPAKTAEREEFWRHATVQFEAILKLESLPDQDQIMAIWLADSWRHLADELAAQSRPKEAEAAYRKGVELSRPLTAQPLLANQPLRKPLRDSANICYSSLINYLITASRRQAASLVCQEAIDFYARLAAESPDEPYFREELARRQAELVKLKETL